MATATEKTARTGPTCTLQEAAAAAGISYSKLRRMAVEDKEFTTARDAETHGSPVMLRWDEVDVYAEGRLPALRKFRVKKGRK